MDLFRKVKNLAKDSQSAGQQQQQQYQQPSGTSQQYVVPPNQQHVQHQQYYQQQPPQQYQQPQYQQPQYHQPQYQQYQQAQYQQAQYQQAQYQQQQYQQTQPQQQYYQAPQQQAPHGSGYQQHQSYGQAPQQAYQTHAPPSSVCLAKDSSLCDAVQFYMIRSDVLSQLNATDIHYDGIVICSACYSTHVAQRPNFASAFTLRPTREQDAQPNGLPTINFDELTCSFSLPRVRAVWYRECVPQGNLQPLVQYYRQTMETPACGGKAGMSLSHWWTAPGNVLSDTGFCDACYEKFIARTAFEPNFQRIPWDYPESGFLCDIGVRTFFYRALTAELDSDSPNFNRFVARMRPRIEAASCPGESVALGQVVVHGANVGKTGVFCAECYHDNVAATVLEKDFTRHWQLEPSEASQPCDLAFPFSKVAMGIAVRRASDEAWRRGLTLKLNGQIPNCVGIRGVDEEELVGKELVVPWYRARQFPAIEVCPRCYTMTADLFGAAPHFEPIQRPLRPGIVRQCFLSNASDIPASNTDRNALPNTLVWRGHLLRRALSHGLIAGGGRFSAFIAMASRIAQMPPPCGTGARALKPINGRQYLGRMAAAGVAGDKTITWCAECHELIMERAKGTALEQELAGSIVDLTAQANGFADGFVCNMHDGSYKNALAEACVAGSWVQFARWYTQAEETRQANMNHQAQMSELSALMQMQQAASTQAASIRLMQSLNFNTNMTIMRI